ncbi:hypothetical protein [Haloglycomyces albus]|uniref:hypothetical protein n=1 Tax=Haloglycomyces albus TaxID=526067 RepID=UPI00046CC6C3|nr:hypothetical protein [Haloglycomyces albus]
MHSTLDTDTATPAPATDDLPPVYGTDEWNELDEHVPSQYHSLLVLNPAEQLVELGGLIREGARPANTSAPHQVGVETRSELITMLV